MRDRIQQLVHALRANNLDPTSEEVADLIWLAYHMGVELQEERRTVSDRDVKSLSDDESMTRDIDEPPPSMPSKPRPQGNSVPDASGVRAYLPSFNDGGQMQSPNGSLPFQASGAAALLGAREIARELRPLMRRVPSRTRVELEIDATVQRIADEKIWAPQLRPTPTRWLELALVIDEGASMAIWQQTIAEFRRLLERHGIFRDVRTWGLVTDATDNELQLRVGIGPAARERLTRSPRELIDPAGRRVILIISDCLAPTWYSPSGKINALVETWSRSGPLALVQLLPQRLWVRSALCESPAALLRAPAPGVPNTRLTTNATTRLLGPAPKDHLKMPVFTLDAKSVAHWAQMVAGVGGAATDGRLLQTPQRGGTIVARTMPRRGAPSNNLSVEQRVNHFMSTASEPAIALAELLSCFPLSLPVMHLVQQTLLPNSLQIHLAEVFLGNLLQISTLYTEQLDPDEVQYDFLPGVRAHLQAHIPASRMLAAMQKVSARIGSEQGHSGFMAQLENPGTNGNQGIQPNSLHFAEIAADVLSRFGGKYAELAERFKRSQIPDPLTPSIRYAQDSNVPPKPLASDLSGRIDVITDSYEIRKPNIIYIDISDPILSISDKPESFTLASSLASLPYRYNTIEEWMTPLLTTNSNIMLLERAREIGEQLFTGLLSTSGSVTNLYRANARQSTANTPLQIRLSVPAHLSSIPWELLWDSTDRQWLAIDQRRTLVRVPPMAERKKKRSDIMHNDVHKRSTPLSVVIAVASPDDGTPTASAHIAENQKHIDAISSRFNHLLNPNAIRTQRIEGSQTRQKLEDRLKDPTPIHVLHIIAQGRIEGDKHLLLLTGKRESDIDKAPTSWLCNALRQRHIAYPTERIQLVILHVDHSAREPQAPQRRSLAAELILAGVPAVLAMQCQAKPNIAIWAIPEFYDALLDAEPIDVALNRARRTLFDRSEPTMDWATPVLFVHPAATDLRLFASPQPRDTQKSEIAPGEFLEAQGVGMYPSNETFFAIRSETLADEFPDIFVIGPLRQISKPLAELPISILLQGRSHIVQQENAKLLHEASHAVKGKSLLKERRSFFLFAKPGYGKTGYRIDTETSLAKTSLVVSINFDEYFTRSINDVEQTLLHIIRRNTYQALSLHFRDPEKIARLRQQHPEQSAFFEQLREESKKPSTARNRIGSAFGSVIRDLAELAKCADLQGIHWMFDSLDSLEHSSSKAQNILLPLIDMLIRLNNPDIAFKFFLPEGLFNIVRDKLRSYPNDIPLYWLAPWSNDQLENMLNRRLEHYSQKSHNPDRIDSFQQLCARFADRNTGRRLCEAAQGSPRRLIELVEGLISEHCRHIDDPSTRIPQSLIDAFLGRV